MPQSFTSLPAELLAQIMCGCGPDIKTVLRLSSTNRWANQVWHDHTIAIACAVFSFTRAELMSFLELAKIEASPLEVIAQESMAEKGAQELTAEQLAQAMTLGGQSEDSTRQQSSTEQSSSTEESSSENTVAAMRESRSEPALQQSRIEQLTQALAIQSQKLESAQHADLSAAVRHHLSWIERSAFGIRVISEGFERQTAETMRRKMNSPSWNETGPEWLKASACFDAHLDSIPAFLLVRGFAVGYNHPSILPAVYAATHGCSYDDVDDLFDVSRILQEECEQHWGHIGIERQEGEPTQWELNVDSHENITNLPRCWSFATYMALVELYWRPEQTKYGTYPEEEKEVHYRYSVLCEYFGGDRFKVMLGGSDRLPWTEERHEARALFWQKKALENPAEYQQRVAGFQV